MTSTKNTGKAKDRYDRRGRQVVDITIHTKVPEKWLFVDQETGDVWERVGEEFKPAKYSVLVLPKLTA